MNWARGMQMEGDWLLNIAPGLPSRLRQLTSADACAPAATRQRHLRSANYPEGGRPSAPGPARRHHRARRFASLLLPSVATRESI